MTWLQAVLLGIVEGVTEFLPISSTGHLTIAEQVMGLSIDDAGVTAFTAVIQLGAIAATFAYFARDISRLASAWARGLVSKQARQARDYRFSWLVIAGSIPIAVVGFAARDLISGPLRNLWVVAFGLIVWSAFMVLAERIGTQTRGEDDLNLRDALSIGLLQCLALIPGVSRSGATISGGLFRGLDRLTATRLSFFLAIPALTAAGAYEALGQSDAIAASVGWGPTIVGTAVSFAAAYASIAWLLRLVVRHPITVFVPYRVALGVALIIALGTGALSAT